MNPGIRIQLLRLVDVVTIITCAVVAFVLRLSGPDVHHAYATCTSFSAVLALTLFPAMGAYESWRGRSLPGLASRLMLAWLAVQTCSLLLMFSLHITENISRLWFASWTAMAAALLTATRFVARSVLRQMRRAGHNLRNVAIVGSATQCARVLGTIGQYPGSGFRAAAALHLNTSAGTANNNVPIFNELCSFAGHVRASQVREVWLALSLSDENLVAAVAEEFSGDLINIRLIPDVSSFALFGGSTTDLLGAPALNLFGSPLDYAPLLKEVFDRAFALVSLLSLAPLMLVIAALVKMSSPGPVFFMQRRQGMDGRVFRIYKFRTMYVHQNDDGVVKQAARGDTRITRVGAFLRRTSLDELPQFLNVLRGEMSVVGPRPHAIEHDEIYRNCVSHYIQRYRIKPGITGWAQVNGYRGETDQIEKMQKRVEHDLYYIRNWTFWLDLRIVLSTIAKGFGGTNAY